MTDRLFTPDEEKILQNAGIVFTALPGHFIYLKGDRADRVYYILKGRVRIFENLPSGREMTLDVAKSGRIFGESAFADNHVRPTCVQAVTKVTLISFRMADILPYFQTRTEFALHFLQLCSNTMDHLTARMEEQCLLDRYGKVASYILDETERDFLEKGEAGGMLPYTHEELSLSLGLNRSTVTMVLKEFEKRGWLEKGYRHMKILDRKGLADMVERQKNGNFCL